MKFLLLALFVAFSPVVFSQHRDETRWRVPYEFKRSIQETELALDEYVEGGCSAADSGKTEAAVDDTKYRHAHLRGHSDFEDASIEHLYREMTRYVAHVHTVCMRILLDGKASTMQSGTWADHLLWKSDLDVLLEHTETSE